MKAKLILLILILSCLYSYSQVASKNPDNMSIIPAGKFQMGKDSERGANYSPAHTVKIDSFYIDHFEVTNKEYHDFCLATGHRLPEFWNTDLFRSGVDYPDYPVVGVSYWDAISYAKWKGKRLPTEAEWEYAARGGLMNKNYPTGDEFEVPKAQRDTNGWLNQIYQVGSYTPNAYGLYDMSGNVWEWVFDKYQPEYYIVSPEENPTGPGKGSGRVIRGGSWHSGGMCKKVFYRKGLITNWCDFAVGFRCAMSIPK